MAKKSTKLSRDIAKAGKQTKKQTKQIGKTFKAAAKAVKSVKKAVAKSAKKAAPKKAAPKSFSLRKAPFARGSTYAERVTAIERNAAAFDKLKKPDELWVATLYGNRTKIPYSSIRLLIDKLNSYSSTKQYANDKGEHGRDLVSGIKIMKFKGSPKQYKGEREVVLKQREEKRGKLMGDLGELFGKKDAKTKRPKTQHDYLEDLLSGFRKQQEEIAKLRSMVTGGASKKKKVAKKTTKKVVKKAAKNTVKKSVVKKSSKKVAKKGGKKK